MSHARGGNVGEGNVVRKSSKRSRIILGAAVASALAGLTASSARAVDYSWKGTAGGPSFWDVGTNWTPAGFPTISDNATFGAGAVDTSVNLHMDPLVGGSGQQSVNNVLLNSTGYNITNGLLTVGGTLTQTGTGNNTISAQVIANNNWTVSGGTLNLGNTNNSALAAVNNFQGKNINVASGATLSAAGGSVANNLSNSASKANVVLANGATFRANGIFSGTDTLHVTFYDSAIDQLGGAPNDPIGIKFNRLTPNIDSGTGLLTLAPNGHGILNRPLSIGDRGQGGVLGIASNALVVSDGAITNDGDLAVAWTGNLNVSAANAGIWNFATVSDDGSVFWIDLNHNGTFENTGDPATNELIVNNNFDQGPTARNDSTSHPNPVLAAGSYKIAVAWFEGRVTGENTAGFISPAMRAAAGGTLDPAVATNFQVINPGKAGNPDNPAASTDPQSIGQSGLWSWTNSGNLMYKADYNDTVNGNVTTITVSPAAASNVQVDALSAKFGTLTLGAGSTLNLTGPGSASFAGTTASGTVTFNAAHDLSTGVIGNGGGSIARINKQGAGTLILDDLTGTTGLTNTSTVSVQAGGLRIKSDGTNSVLGGATISLDGGKLTALAPSGVYGFQGRWYNYGGNPPEANIDPISNQLVQTPTGVVGHTGNIAFSDGAEIGAPVTSASNNAVDNDTFAAVYLSRLHISADNAGVYKFNTISDDGSTVWIDLNHNGVFEYNTDPALNELIVNNNVYQGPTRRSNDTATVIRGHVGHPNLSLAAGDYDVAVGWYEGGGGAEIQTFWQGPATGGAEEPLNGSLHQGLWTATDGTANGADFGGSAVNVTQDASIEVLGSSANFGALTVATGKTLTFNGLGQANFASTRGSGGNLLIVTDPSGPHADGGSADMSAGNIINGGGLTGIVKGGSGTLILDNTSVASGLGAGSNINITKGGLVGTTDGVINPLGAASVTLGDGTNLTLSSKAGGPVSFGNAVSSSGTVRVSAGNRGTLATDNGDVTLNTLNVGAGGTVNLAANNGYFFKIAQNNLAGNANFNNSSSDQITLGNVIGVPSSVVNINGANRLRITGNVAGNNVIINSPGVTFDPGAATTKTVAANTQVFTEMRVATGVIDYGQNVISGNPAHFVAGLYEGRLNNVGQPDRNINKADANPQTGITLNLRRINQGNVDTTNGEVSGWVTDSTYIYSGQIFIPDNDVAGDGLGKIAFGENFDDYTQIKVDGVLKIDDPAWDRPSTSGPIVLSAGWHDIEFRAGQGVGGVGPVTNNGPNWGGTKAIGIDMLGRGTVDGADYVEPADNGTMNLFRALIPVGGTVDIEAGTELKVGGLTILANVNLNGAGALSKLTLNNHTTASNSDVVNINLPGGNALGEVNVGTNTTLTATKLFIEDLGSTFTKSGPGVLRISGPSTVNGTTSIVGGKLQWNGVGSGPGGLVVENGGTLGGSGTYNGAVTVNTGGSISPHDATGIATLTINDSLSMNPSAKLDFNFDGLADSVTVLNNLTLSGNSILNIHAITGFTTGTYRLVTMNNFTDTGDIVLGSNDGPGAFNYSIVETLPAGGNPGHIDLVVTAQQLKWSGATNNVWDINGTVNWVNGVPAPAKYIDLTAVTFDNTGNNRTINVTAPSVNPASITVNNDAAHAYSIGGNPIAGATGVTKRGVGTLSLTGPNTYIGPVLVEEGTLDVNSLANGGSASPLGAGTLPVSLGSASTGGVLRYSGAAAGSTDRGITLNAGGGTVDNAQNATFGGIVSGAGNLTKTGAGTLTLSGITNTNTGNLNVNGGTLSVASMGIGVAPAMINLGAGRTFEYTGASQSGGRGITTADAASTVSVTNAATTLKLSGPVTGPSINKSGAGTLDLAGLVTFSGTAHSMAPNSGTLSYSGTAGNTINGTYTVNAGSTLRSAPGSISSVAVSLNGGTLSLAGPTSKAGLNAEFYQFGPDTPILNTIQDFDNVLVANSTTRFGTSNTSTADLDPDPNVHGAMNHIAAGGNPFSQYIDDTTLTPVAAPGGNDNLVSRYTGKLNVPIGKGGTFTFFTASDDGSKLWIDGVEVVNNNFFQGTTERGGSINLAEGAHDVVVGFYEGGGDASMILRWIPVGGGKDVTPNSAFSSGSADWNNTVTTAAGVTSTIDVTSTATGNIGALSLGNNSTLRVTNGGVHTSGTVLPVAGGTYNFDSGWDINLNQVTSSGAVTLNHTGIGQLILETNNLAGPAAGSTINMNGGTLAPVGNAGSTNPIGSAAVNLGNGGGILLSARTGDVTFDNLVSATGTVRVGSGVAGSATPGPHTLTLGSTAKPLTLANGTTVNLSANNGTSLVLPAVQMAGDATFAHSSTNVGASNNVRIGNINMAGGTASFTGARQVTLTGNVTGVVNNVVVNNNALNVDPGASGTSNINGPVKVVSVLNVATGTTSLGNNIISGQTASVTAAGLLEQFANGPGGDFYTGPIATRTNTYNVPDSIQLEPRRANQATGNTNGNPPGQGGNAPGWTDNSTYIYTGQILVPDNGTAFDGVGHVAFGMRFDDSIQLKIDGNEVMNDRNWNNATSSGELILKAGWHDIEMRFGEGGGGVGPNSGSWPGTFADGTPAAVGYQTDDTLGFDGNSAFDGSDGTHADINKYTAPRDNGSGNLFRQATGVESGDINVAAGATLVAGGLDHVNILNLNGGASPARANLSNSAVFAGSVTAIRANGEAGAVNNLSLGANNTLNANQLAVADGTIFNKEGAGTLRIQAVSGASLNGVHNFGNDSEVHVNGGKLIVNTNSFGGTGSVFVASGATLGGNGKITGAVSAASGGHIAAGDGLGTLTVGGLSLNSSFLDVEGSAAGFDLIKVASDGSADVFNANGTNTFTLFDLGGVAAGDYPILDYTNTAALADLSHFTIANPGAFPTLVATLFNDTANQDIVLHLEPGIVGGAVEWNVDANGSWGVGGNWLPTNVPDGDTAIANMFGKITAPRTVTLDGNRTVAQLNFNNANSYTIASGTGGTLTVKGQINLTGGSHAITAPVAIGSNTTVNGPGALAATGGFSIGAGNTLTKTGIGTLSIGGAQGHGVGSALTVDRGVVNLNSNAGTTGSAAGSNLSVNIVASAGSARVNVGANQDLAALNVAFGDAGTQTLDLQSPAGAGQFHSVAVYAANLTAAKAALYNAIANANHTTPTPPADPLDGIVDSGLHSGAEIGLAQIGDHIMIRPTRVGDLNLDGQVTISDFIDLASNFNTIGTATWQEGDLNYDHNVTISDFIDLASNFNGSYVGGAGPVSADDLQTLSAFASSVGVDPSVIGSAVPEPGTMGLLAIGAMGLMSGRRRRNRKA